MFHFSKDRGRKPMYIIAGLGNPGSQYATTRHNIGFMAIDRLAEHYDVTIDRHKFSSLTAQCMMDGKKVLLMKPLTYMNNSGEAIAEAAAYYKIPPENIVVISDDINLDPGKMRIRSKGSAGGHNGLKSIIECLGSDQFPRVRVGIGDRKKSQMSLADFVLSHFTEEDLKLLEEPRENAGKAAELILDGDITEAMNRYNRTK